MSGGTTERKLAAILAADVVGFSRQMGADEAATLARIAALRSDVLEPLLAEHRGRLFKTMGDGFLAEFASAVQAVACAMAVQTLLAEQPGGVRLRIGVHTGDVAVQGEDLMGDGVNIAARLEPLAEAGGIVISARVREDLVGKLTVVVEDIGEPALKNIATPIRAYRIRPAAAPERPILSLPDKPSIAVLPFDNMSSDPEQGYFADGVTEALTAALSRIRSFFVIARNSAFAYKGRAVNVRDIGRELGVAYVLEGSVQRSGQRVRITVQLIETTGGAHLWAEKYDGALDDIFDLQDRITEQVAGALQPSIRLAEVERVRHKRPQDLGAYDYAMRAMPHVWMLERSEATKALDLLGRALDIDPDYPLALALAAWCWAQRSVYNWVDDLRDAKSRAITLAEKAANLSSDEPLILAILGATHTQSRNYGTSRALLERAILLDPNAAWAFTRLGWLELYTDRPDIARPHFERAMRLSPLDPLNFNCLFGLGVARQMVGEETAAVQLFQRALQERPSAHWIHRNLAPALLKASRENEARDSIAALLAAYPDLTIRKCREAIVLPERVMDELSQQWLILGLPEG